MANIAISEINRKATSINKNDLLLISQASEDGTSFTSASIKASYLGDIATRKVVEVQDIYVYISPDGNDNNLDKQYEYFGTEQQRAYPLFSLNAAIRLIAKINQIWSINKIAHINCKPGTYNFTEAQYISGNYRDYGSYIKIEKDISTTGDVIFKLNFELTSSYTSLITLYCNTKFQSIKLIGRDDYKTKYNSGYITYSIVAFNSILSIYGAEISKFSCAIQGNSDSEINLRSNFTNIGTLSTIESNYEPIYIHDCMNGIQAYNSKAVSIENWIRIDTQDYPFDMSGTCPVIDITSLNGASKKITRLDLRSRTKKKLVYSAEVNQNRFSIFSNNDVFEMNIYNDIEQYTTNPKSTGFTEAFGNSFTINAGYWILCSTGTIELTNLNVNKF